MRVLISLSEFRCRYMYIYMHMYYIHLLKYIAHIMLIYDRMGVYVIELTPNQPPPFSL